MAMKWLNDACGCPPCETPSRAWYYHTGDSDDGTTGQGPQCFDPDTGIPISFWPSPWPGTIVTAYAAGPVLSGGRIGLVYTKATGTYLIVKDANSGAVIFDIQVDGTTLGIPGTVRCLVALGGDWFVGVTRAGTSNAIYRAFINSFFPSGAVSPLAFFTGGKFNMMAGSNGLLYVMGNISTIAGVTRPRMLCMDPATSTAVTAFDAHILASPLGAPATDDAGPWFGIERGGKIYLATGGISSINTGSLSFSGQYKKTLVAVDLTTGALDTGFDPFPLLADNGWSEDTQHNNEFSAKRIVLKQFPAVLPSTPAADYLYLPCGTKVGGVQRYGICRVSIPGGVVSDVTLPTPFWTGSPPGYGLALAFVGGDMLLGLPNNPATAQVVGGRQGMTRVSLGGAFTDTAWPTQTVGGRSHEGQRIVVGS